VIAIVAGAGDAAAASTTARPASVASGVCASAARGTNTSSGINRWEEGFATVAGPSSPCTSSHALLSVSDLFLPLFTQVAKVELEGVPSEVRIQHPA
jgi:hypothetical protein